MVHIAIETMCTMVHIATAKIKHFIDVYTLL
jgi:hypothetical protein